MNASTVVIPAKAGIQSNINIYRMPTVGRKPTRVGMIVVQIGLMGRVGKLKRFPQGPCSPKPGRAVAIAAT